MRRDAIDSPKPGPTRLSWRLGVLYVAFAVAVIAAVGVVLKATAPGLSTRSFLIVIGGGSALARLLFFVIARR